MDCNKYRTELPYGLTDAEKAEWTARIKHEEETFVGTKAQIEAHVADFKAKRDLADKVAKEAYGRDNARLEKQFWADAFESLGIDPNHPKIAILKRIAWDKGHSSGYSSVYCELCDLEELL